MNTLINWSEVSRQLTGDRTRIRADYSDHSRVYETAQLNHFDFVVNSIEEMDTVIDEINSMPIF